MPSTPPPIRRPALPPRQTRPQKLGTTPKPSATSTVVGNPREVAATLKKRQTGLWAVGVAIIVGAGSILGAQLKSSQQEQEWLSTAKEQDNPLTTGNTIGSPKSANNSNAGQTLGEIQEQIPQARQPSDYKTSSVRSLTQNQRQISFLEDRRGVLMNEKFNLEQKIERVQEKRKKEEEMENRRKVEIADER